VPKASHPIRDGGLGTRRLSMLTTSAYLASGASTVLLVGTILDAEEWIDTYKDEMMQSRKDSLPTVMDPMPEQQRLWDRPLIDHDKAIMWNGCGYPLGKAILRALMPDGTTRRRLVVDHPIDRLRIGIR